MTKEDAIKFLKNHQPMPDDIDLSEQLIEEYDNVRKFFLCYQDKECIPLFLNSFGAINGAGVYQLVEDVILQYPKEDVIPHLKKNIESPIYSLQYWGVQIAINYPDDELLPCLMPILKNPDFDLKYMVLLVLSQYKLDAVTSILLEYIDYETNQDLIDLANKALRGDMY